MDLSDNINLLTDCFFLEVWGYDIFLSFLLGNWSGVVHVVVGTVELDLLNGSDGDYFASGDRRSSRLRFLGFFALLKVCLFAGFAALLVHASPFPDHLIVHFIQTKQFAFIFYKFLPESASGIQFSSRIHKEISIVLLLLDLPDYEILNDL